MSKELTYTICEKCNGLNRVPFELPNGKTPVCGKCKNELSIHNGVSELNALGLETLSNKSPLPVVVDFWAPWCGPCRSFAPTFISAADQLKGQIVFAKIDTEAHSTVSPKYNVRGIPTLVVFKQGKEINRISGALPLNDFLIWVRQSI